MVHYFFDVKAKTSIEHDYTGRRLPSLEDARQLADLIAMDLSCIRADEADGLEVQIRAASGTLLSSIPVRVNGALAA